ncbi:hypothetical protein GDO78_010111 [Eleutherodactylus coqui]|uniref:Uncharacterized protein n=1 Tax=Eleutherodactylus coqui TaxID=57060 RepID=A0A8J6FCK0_ELECQ|nr:hypothetical protein GDO78_010111 [Eleutherodactylus coqui]
MNTSTKSEKQKSIPATFRELLYFAWGEKHFRVSGPSKTVHVAFSGLSRVRRHFLHYPRKASLSRLGSFSLLQWPFLVTCLLHDVPSSYAIDSALLFALSMVTMMTEWIVLRLFSVFVLFNVGRGKKFEVFESS